MGKKKDLTNRITEAIILRLLAERKMYGYEILRLVNEKTDGAFRWQEGTLYPCLHALETRGLLQSDWDIGGDKPRKYYRLTGAGKRAVKEKVGEVSDYMSCVHALLFNPV